MVRETSVQAVFTAPPDARMDRLQVFDGAEEGEDLGHVEGYAFLVVAETCVDKRVLRARDKDERLAEQDEEIIDWNDGLGFLIKQPPTNTTPSALNKRRKRPARLALPLSTPHIRAFAFAIPQVVEAAKRRVAAQLFLHQARPDRVHVVGEGVVSPPRGAEKLVESGVEGGGRWEGTGLHERMAH